MKANLYWKKLDNDVDLWVESINLGKREWEVLDALILEAKSHGMTPIPRLLKRIEHHIRQTQTTSEAISWIEIAEVVVSKGVPIFGRTNFERKNIIIIYEAVYIKYEYVDSVFLDSLQNTFLRLISLADASKLNENVNVGNMTPFQLALIQTIGIFLTSIFYKKQLLQRAYSVERLYSLVMNDSRFAFI